MDLLAETFARLISITFGVGFACVFFAVTHNRAGARWRQIADAYPAPHLDEPLSSRHFETVILHTGGRIFNSYRGWVTARIFPTGVGLSLPPPLSVGHPPIFIPFNEATVETYPWYLAGDAYEIKALRTPEIKIIVHETLASAFGGAGRGAAASP